MNTYIYAYRRTKRGGILHGTMEAESLEQVLNTLNEVTSDDGGEIIMIGEIMMIGEIIMISKIEA